MPIYESQSKGPIDTAEMDARYIQRALAKAIREGDEDNISALEEEIRIRNGEDEPITEEEIIEENATFYL